MPHACRCLWRVFLCGLAWLSCAGAAQARGPLPEGVRLEPDVAWGELFGQTLDVYLPAGAPAASPSVPAAGSRSILLMVHGGAWSFGDKRHAAVTVNKAAHWVGQGPGQVLVSMNYRMLPDSDPADQARQVARALAFVQAHAAQWGADPSRVVLMGHSAGAHLVALLSADPALARAQGAAAWRATVALDSAAMDVPRIMTARHLGLYDRAFGRDPAGWQQVSPWHQLRAAGVPLLLVCSSRRETSCDQAGTLAERQRRLGGVAEVLPQDLSHGDINAELGRPGAYTDAVDAFLRRHAGL